MIYVKRDERVIPNALLKQAEEAQKALEGLPEAERRDFIKKKARIWGEFPKYLAEMSYGKCWYSESDEPQSFFHVDHFRPKAEAIRASGEKDDGYPWLAFDWHNFRLAAQRSNQRNQNEDTGEIEGKGSWFPLLDGSPRATWENRCVNDEKPVLLDPTVRADVDLVDIGTDGKMCCSKFCIGSAEERVKRSVELLGLDLPKLVEARKRVMRRINDLFDTLIELMRIAGVHRGAADALPIKQQIEQNSSCHTSGSAVCEGRTG